MVAERGTGRVNLYNVTVPPLQPGGVSPSMLVVDLGPFGVDVPPSQGHWYGLSGIAFHPEFLDDRKARYIFVRYTAGYGNTNATIDTVVDRFRIPPGVNTVDPTSRVNVFRDTFYTDSEQAHCVGGIHFDPRPRNSGGVIEPVITYDLYVPLGDHIFGQPSVMGPGNCNPGMEDCAALFDGGGNRLYTGKLMRFPVGPLPLANGSSVPQTLPNVVGVGLRNPYSWSIDRGDSSGNGVGDIWLTDVGSNQKPGEIMHLPAYPLNSGDCYSGGACTHFGWPFVETVTIGVNNQGNVDANCNAEATNPFPNQNNLFPKADHGVPGTAGQALIGGCVYRGSALAGLQYQGQIFYGVFGSVPKLIHTPVGSVDDSATDDDLSDDLLMDVAGPNSFSGNFIFAGFGVDSDGEMYLVRHNANASGVLNNDDIFRIDP